MSDPDAGIRGHSHLSANRRALRTIAIFESAKGIAALAASVGLLELAHRDLRHLAEALIGHFGLHAENRFPSLFLHYAEVLGNANLRNLVLLAWGYSAVRLLEKATGLWPRPRLGRWQGRAVRRALRAAGIRTPATPPEPRSTPWCWSPTIGVVIYDGVPIVAPAGGKARGRGRSRKARSQPNRPGSQPAHQPIRPGSHSAIIGKTDQDDQAQDCRVRQKAIRP